MDQVSFCPHCGEDLRGLAPADAAPPPPPRRSVMKREVPSTEVERLWGLAPLPFQMRPFGVVVEGDAGVPVALACESHEGKMWECARGQVKMLEAPTSPQQAAPASAPGQAPLTVPSHPAPGPGNPTLHNCAPESGATREGRGGARYGSA